MTRRYIGGIYHYLGTLGNICTDKDTNSEKDAFRFKIGYYLNPVEVREAQLNFFRSKFPDYSEQEIKHMVLQAESLSNK